MAYNRWINYSDELYHRGVKGMKWGKHLFGNGAEIPQGSGGGGFLDEPELPEYTGPTLADVAAGKATMEDYQIASAKYQEAVDSYREAKKKYEHSPLFALKHPLRALEKGKDAFEDRIGLTDRHDTNAYKYKYEQAKKSKISNYIARTKKAYEMQRAKYYKTPIGKVAKYVDAGKAAVSAFSNYARSN